MPDNKVRFGGYSERRNTGLFKWLLYFQIKDIEETWWCSKNDLTEITLVQQKGCEMRNVTFGLKNKGVVFSLNCSKQNYKKIYCCK